jgi:membrane dipeptidase
VIPVFDGHNDTLLRLYRAERDAPRSFLQRAATGHIDLPRAREGGLCGGFFAIFVPPGTLSDGAVTITDTVLDVTITDTGYEVPLAPSIDPTYAQRAAMAMIARLFRLEQESAGHVRVVRTVDELIAAMHEDVFSAIPHFEGAEAIDPHLDALEVILPGGSALSWPRLEPSQRLRAWCAFPLPRLTGHRAGSDRGRP